jgi:hypothetical protein
MSAKSCNASFSPLRKMGKVRCLSRSTSGDPISGAPVSAALPTGSSPIDKRLEATGQGDKAIRIDEAFHSLRPGVR